jgi:hypothetical protein
MPLVVENHRSSWKSPTRSQSRGWKLRMGKAFRKERARIWLAAEATDMRCGFDRLAEPTQSAADGLLLPTAVSVNRSHLVDNYGEQSYQFNMCKKNRHLDSSGIDSAAKSLKPR